MSLSSGHKVLIGAFAVSATVHSVLMAFFKPQVMMRYEDSLSRAAPRRSIVVNRRAEQPPAPVSPGGDFAPVAEGPDASTDALLPRVSSLDETARETAMAAAPPPPVDFVPGRDVAGPAPKLSESLPDDIEMPFAKPMADVPDTGFLDASMPEADFTQVSAVHDEPPAPVLPSLEPAPEIEREQASIPPPETELEKETEVFVPPAEVMAEVDETVVEAEKAAVKGLLDAGKPKDLQPLVKCEAKSAADEKWIYFRVKFKPSATLQVVPKDVVVLVDASGSIASDRLRSCRKAAKELLRTCTNTGDRFNLVAFRDRFDYAFRTWRPCDRESFDAADSWISAQAAHGRTDVFSTISSVLTLPRDPSRPLIALVVTDGEANSGVSGTAEILSKFTALNDGLVSVYIYGVKSGGNTELIDLLTRGNRGESLIHEGSRSKAGSGIGRLSERFRDPVLSDLRVIFTAGSKAEAYPRRLKNLYRGESVELVGRVPKGTEEVAFSLRGLNGTRAYEGFFKFDPASVSFDETLQEEWTGEQSLDRRLR
ncbi:MAG: VWA domain-containing protein [Kiritimatiellae bacterium]|nr:VWA domain-containing protein [Kiritimatiellia bacterium]